MYLQKGFLSAERRLHTRTCTHAGNGNTVAWLTPHAAIVLEDGRCSFEGRRIGSAFGSLSTVKK
jgi:hypothetical protein